VGHSFCPSTSIPLGVFPTVGCRLGVTPPLVFPEGLAGAIGFGGTFGEALESSVEDGDMAYIVYDIPGASDDGDEGKGGEFPHAGPIASIVEWMTSPGMVPCSTSRLATASI